MIEKIKAIQEVKDFADKEIFEIRADVVDLKADDEEIKRNLSTINQEFKKMEHFISKISERTAHLEAKTKTL